MPNLKKIIILYFAFTYAAFGQDVHFTNYQNHHHIFNPALCGNFLGSIKVQSIYRSQYQHTYQNVTAGGEFNLSSPLHKKHWLGVGLNLVHDKAGDLKLRSNGLGLNLAYHIPIGKKQNQTIAAGIVVSSYSLRADDENFRSEFTIQGKTGSDPNKINGFQNNYLSVGAGVAYTTALSKKNIVQLGLALLHFNQPGFSFNQSKNTSRIGKRLNAHASFKNQALWSASIEPRVYYSYSENESNFNVQCLSELKLKKSNSWQLVMGLGSRLGESIYLITGYKSPSFQITASLDHLIGNNRLYIGNTGAMELGGFYIFTLKKTPKLKPIILCPRL